MNIFKVLSNVLKRPLGQSKDGLDLEHSQLEVVSVQYVGHVANKQLVLFKF